MYSGCDLVLGGLEYSRGAIYRGRYTASRAALGVLKISRSAIYRGRYTASRTPLPRTFYASQENVKCQKCYTLYLVYSSQEPVKIHKCYTLYIVKHLTGKVKSISNGLPGSPGPLVLSLALADQGQGSGQLDRDTGQV